MCCVIPPASPAATDVLRSVSSRVVLPWSTCPIIVTTGGRSFSTDGSGGGLTKQILKKVDIQSDKEFGNK